MATICIVGLWHQGSVLSACLADLGHQVRGVDEEPSIAALNAGRPPVHEPLLATPLGAERNDSRRRRGGCAIQGRCYDWRFLALVAQGIERLPPEQ